MRVATRNFLGLFRLLNFVFKDCPMKRNSKDLLCNFFITILSFV